jgi:hypothetical protein
MTHRLLTDPDAWRASFRRYASGRGVKDADTAPVGVLAPRVDIVEVTANRDVVFTANTDDIDLDSEVVIPGGADRTHIEKNAQAFADHCYDLTCNVGAIRKTWLAGNRWMQRVFVYDRPGIKELCADILYLARLGKIGASIGFVALDYGPPSREELETFTKGGRKPESVVRKWLWLETSFTAMPCNVACQVAGGGGLLIDERIADLDQLVTKNAIRRASAVALGLPESPQRRYHPVQNPPTRRIVVVS